MPSRTKNSTYLRTHSWITFQIDLARAGPQFWLALGEARSKCEHLSGVPLKPEVAQRIHQVYLAKGALATTAIEGNTLTEREALAIVQKKSELPESQAYLEQELNNVLDVSNAILGSIESRGVRPITVEEIKSYNKKILNRLEVADYVVPGECTKIDIAVAGYHGAPWQECEMLLKKLCDWLNTGFSDDSDGGVTTGIIKAILAHLYLVWIHPFGDGNGRTARILEVRFLTEAGISSAAAHLLSNFYNRTRGEYYRRLKEASRSEAGVIAFVTYAARGFVEELRQQLKFVKAQQWDVSWINYVYEQFQGRKSPSDKRRLDLILALSKVAEPVPRSDIKKLSPEVAASYASKTDKTLSRDLNALQKMGLLSVGPTGMHANNSIILAFLPRAKKGSIEAQLKEISSLVEDVQLSLKL